LGVIETDTRDNGQERPAHVGRVEAAAQAHLDHGDVRPPPDEMEKSQSRRHLEESDTRPAPRLFVENANGRLHIAHEGRELVLRDRLAMDLNPLLDALQMWRGE